MKAPIIDTTGKNVGSMDLPKDVFEAEVNEQILAQYVRVYRHRQRQNTVSVQTRSDVKGTTAKVWRQKGTGRARHGSRKAPIFVKGGQAHGPSGEVNFDLKISKKQRKIALTSAFSARAKEITVIEGIDKLKAKTKELESILNKIAPEAKKITVIMDKPYESVIKAGNNIKRLNLTQASRINAFEILNGGTLYITKPSLEMLTTTPKTESKKETKKTDNPPTRKASEGRGKKVRKS